MTLKKITLRNAIRQLFNRFRPKPVHAPGTLSVSDLQRLVAEMVG